MTRFRCPLRRFLSALLITLLVSAAVVAGPASAGGNLVADAASVDEIVLADDYDELDDAAVLRLYRAFFDREPDAGGARYWLDVRDEVGLLPIAEYFTQSDEFKDNYAGTSDREYLTRVYANVLGRAFDQGGFNYWLDLIQGTNASRTNPALAQISRGEAVFWITASSEFKSTYPYQPVVIAPLVPVTTLPTTAPVTTVPVATAAPATSAPAPSTSTPSTSSSSTSVAVTTTPATTAPATTVPVTTVPVTTVPVTVPPQNLTWGDANLATDWASPASFSNFSDEVNIQSAAASLTQQRAAQAADPNTDFRQSDLAVHVLIMADSPWTAIHQDKAETVGKVLLSWTHDQLEEYGLPALLQTSVHAVPVRHELTEAQFLAAVAEGTINPDNSFIGGSLGRLLADEDKRPHSMQTLALTGQAKVVNYAKATGGGNEGGGSARFFSYIFHPDMAFSGDDWTDIDLSDTTSLELYNYGAPDPLWWNTTGLAAKRTIGSGLHEMLHAVGVNHGGGSAGAQRGGVAFGSAAPGQTTPLMGSGSWAWPNTDISASAALQVWSSAIFAGDLYDTASGAQVSELFSWWKVERANIENDTIETGIGVNGFPYIKGTVAFPDNASFQSPRNEPIMVLASTAVANGTSQNEYSARKHMGTIRQIEDAENGYVQYEFVISLRDERFEPGSDLKVMASIVNNDGTTYRATDWFTSIDHLGNYGTTS